MHTEQDKKNYSICVNVNNTGLWYFIQRTSHFNQNSDKAYQESATGLDPSPWPISSD